MSGLGLDFFSMIMNTEIPKMTDEDIEKVLDECEILDSVDRHEEKKKNECTRYDSSLVLNKSRYKKALRA